VKAAPALALASLTLACAGPHAGAPEAVPAGLDAAAAREVLVRFADDLQERRFERAYALLSPRWRALTSPSRLASDFAGAAAVAGEAAARASSRGRDAPVSIEAGRARVDLGEGHAAALVAEAGAWRVDALEAGPPG
jgi:hypothetical protein